MYEKKRLEYIDFLKFLAIFAIVALHVFQVWKGGPQIKHIDIYAFSQITRFGVPLFIMISGALLLNRDIEIKSFLKRRTSRLIYPFIFFFILTYIFAHLTNMGVSQVSNIFAFKWYFWMILGVYFSIPIINKFIQNSTMEEIEYFIIMIFAAAIFYQTTYHFKIEMFLDLNLFLSPLGYLVLGYYLSKKDFGISTNKMVSIALILFIVTTLVKFGGQIHVLPLLENFEAAKSAMLSSYLDLGITELLQTSAVFVLGKYIYECTQGLYLPVKNLLQTTVISKSVLSISRASYGIYLINTIPTVFFHNTIKHMHLTGTEVFLAIICLSIIVFIVSWIIIVLLSKIPYINKLSGYA